jgi:hypothetical protein
VNGLNIMPVFGVTVLSFSLIISIVENRIVIIRSSMGWYFTTIFGVGGRVPGKIISAAFWFSFFIRFGVGLGLLLGGGVVLGKFS